MSCVRILHTSDWHLGRTLREKVRDDEFDEFLKWLLNTIESEKIDVLLVAGDIFDTPNPTYSVQQKYYDFCTKLSQTCCRHAVITSGNHDSSVFIDVPGEILSHLNIHVVGRPRFGVGKRGNPADEVIVLKDESGNDILIVVAVPFLSDGDVRFSTGGEDTATKEQKVIAGVTEHYRLAEEVAEKLRAGRDIPVVVMGHLYVMGGKVLEDASERVTYVGTIGGINASIFGDIPDYIALGHLHIPQCVGGCDFIRYSGSPLVMGFGEAGQQKSVCIVEFNGRKRQITTYPVPSFRKIARISGDKKTIQTEIERLIQEGEEVYVSVTYTGHEYIDNVMSLVQDIIGDSSIIRCLDSQNKQIIECNEKTEISNIQRMTLDDLSEHAVFERLLDKMNVDSKNRESLTDTFNELLIMVQNE